MGRREIRERIGRAEETFGARLKGTTNQAQIERGVEESKGMGGEGSCGRRGGKRGRKVGSNGQNIIWVIWVIRALWQRGGTHQAKAFEGCSSSGFSKEASTLCECRLLLGGLWTISHKKKSLISYGEWSPAD